MPRTARAAPGGVVFHCLNRGNDRSEIFADDGERAAFRSFGVAITVDTVGEPPIPIGAI